MTVLDSIAAKLGTAEPWVQKGGVSWLDPCPLNVRNLAKAMNALSARFVTITAYQLPAGEGFRLEYHWDLDGQMLGFPYRLSGNSIESIYDLCEAADWIEREVHEGFAVDFLGRDYEPLLLRPGDKLGVNLREEVVR
jgi:NADH:ubiquinone oxidoreductase subunit C